MWHILCIFFLQFRKLDLIYDYKKIAYHLWCWSPFPLKFMKRMHHKLIKIQNRQSKFIVRPEKMELPTQSDPISILNLVYRTRCIYEPTKLAICLFGTSPCKSVDGIQYSQLQLDLHVIVSIKVTTYCNFN